MDSIKLEVKSADYNYMMAKISDHKATLHTLNIHDGFKKSLIEDMHIVSNILTKSKKGDINEHNGNS